MATKDAPAEAPETPMDADELAELLDEHRKLKRRESRQKSDLKNLRTEVRSLTKETHRLATELEKLRNPPHIVGTVIDLLDDGRVVIKSSTGPNFVVPVGDHVALKQVEIGTRVSLSQQNLTVVGVLPPGRDPIVRGTEMVGKPNVTYADIGGLDDILEEVKEAVEYPLTRPDAYLKLGIVPPKGVLLCGPPGTGKTLIAKAVANATGATFLRMVGSELVQKFIGEGARRVREMFQMARDKAPCVLFIDEIDAVGGKRVDDGTSSNREVERTMMQLLAELDGFEGRGEVRILAATNRRDILDPALLRPGRFDRIIDVPLPNEDALGRIFAIHTQHLALADDVDGDDLVSRLGTATGADVGAVCTEAGMQAVRKGRKAIAHADFVTAIERLHRGGLASGGVAGEGAGLYA